MSDGRKIREIPHCVPSGRFGGISTGLTFGRTESGKVGSWNGTRFWSGADKKLVNAKMSPPVRA